MRVHVFFLVLGVLAIAPSAAHADGFEWVFDQEYRFVEFHDPGYLVLEDPTGERSDLYFGYTGLGYEVVKGWTAGKAIRVAYAADRGTEVVDPASGDRWPIPDAWPRIDDLLQRCRSEAVATVEMQACDEGAVAAWNLEADRAYELLMKSGVSDATKEAIRSAQQEWVDYRDATLAALRAYVLEDGGSIRRVYASNRVVELAKHRAGVLLRYDAPPAPSSHCTADEVAVFYCGIDGKNLSVCRLGDGRVSYRFGKLGEPEITIDSIANFSSRAYSGGGESRLRFTRGEYDYLVFSFIHRGEIIDEESGVHRMHEGSGVRVVQDGKSIATLDCTDLPDARSGIVMSHELTTKQEEDFVDFETD